MEDLVLRQKTIEGIRAIASLLEANPDLEIPYEWGHLSHHVWTVSQVQEWIHALPGKKAKDYSGDTFKVTSDLGLGTYEVPRYGYYIIDDEGNNVGVDHTTYEGPSTMEYGDFTTEGKPYFKVTIMTSRKTVCTPKVVGKELVEQKVYPQVEPVTTLVEQDIVEWECNPVLGD